MESAAYAVGSVAGKLVGLVMLPILTRLLAPDDYGRLDVLSTLASAAISGLLIGIDVAFVRLYTDPQSTRDDRRRMVGSWAAMAALLVAAPAAFLVLAASTISDVLFGSADYAGAVAAVGLVLVLGTFHVLGLSLLRAQRRAIAYAVVSAISLATNAVLAVALLVGWEAGVTAVLIALAVSWAVGAILAFVIAGWRAIGPPNRAVAGQLLRLGLPLAPAVAAVWIGEFANRAILMDAAGPSEVGYFSVALRFASIAGIVVVGFQLAWQPHAFSLGLGADARAEIGRDGRRILILVSTVVAAVAVIAPEAIIFLSGERYVGAIQIVGFALVLQVATAAVMVASMPSAMAKSMGNIGIASVVGVTVGVGCTIILAPLIGGIGAAISMAIGQATAASVVWYLGKALVLQVMWPRCLVVMGASAIVAVASTAAIGESVVARLLLLAVFLITVAWEGTALGIFRKAPTPAPAQEGR